VTVQSSRRSLDQDPLPPVNFRPLGVPRGGLDWHANRSNSEPRCGADQWRTRDRSVVMYMHEMTDKHLGHCIRFSETKRQHTSRLASLLAEDARRRLAATPG
jgi:hypothetical protein